ncbi:MAG: DUF4397 domain-containing protein [Candidatus Bipolaricaulia bacterium]
MIVETDTTQAQFIHNAADPSIEAIDLYFENEKFRDDLSFRAATRFIYVPANFGLDVGFAPGSSSGPSDIIASQTITFDADSTYSVVANGVLNPDRFASNPDQEPIGFKFFVEASAKTSADGAQVAFRGVHGATDAPTIDILADGRKLFGKLTYEDVTQSYKSLSAGEKGLVVTPSDSFQTLKSFRADLSPLRGEAATLLASGFLDPSSNQGGPALRLLAVRPDGTVKQFPVNQTPQLVESSIPPDTTVLVPGPDVGGSAFDLDATDADPNDTVSFLLGQAPDGATLASSTGQFSWSPTFSQRDSTYQITVRATDGIDTTATSFSISVEAQTAKAQFIHNAADPNLQRIDLYLDTKKIADNLSFRAATSFLRVPAGGSVTLGVAKKDSRALSDTVASQSVTFTPDSTYTTVASGVLKPRNFAKNPNDKSTALKFYVEPGALQKSASNDSVVLRAAHGATDLPTVRLDQNGTTLFSNLTYGDVTPGYLTVPANEKRLVLTHQNAQIKAFQADTLATFGGRAATVLLSGFQDSSAVNQGGPSLQLIAALPNGEVVPLRKNRPPKFTSVPKDFSTKPKTKIDTSISVMDPDGDSVALSVTTPLPRRATFTDTSGRFTWTPTLTDRDSTYQVGVRASDGEAATDTAFAVTVQTGTAPAQFIHNAADPNIDTADVYLDGVRILNDFSFRSATSLQTQTVPTGVTAQLGIAPKTSRDSGDVLAAQPVTFSADSSYTIVASGLLEPDNFADNPAGKAVSFKFFVQNGARTQADGDQVNLRAVHSVTDAPSLDVEVVGNTLSAGTSVFKGIAYGDVTAEYHPVTSEEKRFLLNQADTSNAIAAFRKDLSQLGGQAAVLLVSGFLRPSRNENGPALEMLVVERDGAVDTLKQNSPPRFVSRSVPGDTTVMPGTTLEGPAFNLDATDPEGDSITYSLDQAPKGAAIDSTNGQFTWTPTLTQRDSTYQIKARASDGPSGTDTTFAVTVQTNKASVQFVHNVADPNVKKVDLYLDEAKVADDIAFRSATPFIKVPADLTVTMSLTPGSAGGAADSLLAQSITFDSDSIYTVAAGGVANPDNFANNPDGKHIGLAFFVEPGAKAKSSPSGKGIALRMVHGVTDAPTVNIVADESVLFRGLAYGTVTSDYRTVPAEDTRFFVTPGPPTRALGTFQADTLSSLRGRTATLIASGFVDSSAVNQGGAGLQLLAALPNGEILSFDRVKPTPDSISVSIDQSFNGGRQRSDYRLVGLPGRVDLPIENTLPGSSPSDWRAFTDNGQSLVEFDGSNRFNFRPGRGFWLISENDWRVSRSVRPVRLSDSSNAHVPLHDGWNIISNPLGKAVPWAAVQTENGISGGLFRWTGSTYSLDSTFASARRGVAYYFLNDAGLDTLDVPALKSSRTAARSKRTEGPRLRLEVLSDSSVVASAWIGMQAGAKTGRDRFDRVSPPQYFGPTSLQVKNEKIDSDFPLVVDIRPADANGHTYHFRLNTNPGTTLILRAKGIDQWREGLQARLYDNTRGRTIDLREQSSIDVTPQRKWSTYTLIVGRSSYVSNQMSRFTPEEFRVWPNYPNPFRDRTTVKYALPKQMTVHARIYDVLGRRVRTLVRGKTQPAGIHTVTWDGTTNSGGSVASGTYFIRVRAGGHTQTFKMVVIR